MKKRLITLLILFITGTLIGCAPPKDKSTHENTKQSEEDKEDKKIKVKVADEEDDRKEKKEK
ncbi:hypothetical protein [Bacillus sp. REN16]|uniref:hypothetical protein n=1 Tax=Bacillus sp. REN16 TaxID=2887296 RepID=UPI001E57F52F|nr:hypothetical protein [Bacillus sp. REN16]MCC3355686.1 hypothetical protein [Bacillus sp. REN16]